MEGPGGMISEWICLESRGNKGSYGGSWHSECPLGPGRKGTWPSLVAAGGNMALALGRHTLLHCGVAQIHEYCPFSSVLSLTS